MVHFEGQKLQQIKENEKQRKRLIKIYNQAIFEQLNLIRLDTMKQLYIERPQTTKQLNNKTTKKENICKQLKIKN